MKRIAFLTILIILSFAFVIYQREKPQPIVVMIDDDRIEFDQTPLLENGVLLVEAEPLFAKLGLKTEFNPQTKILSAVKEKLNMRMQLGSNDFFVNGLNFKFPVPPRLAEGVPYVPMRLIAEFTDKVVFWNQETKTVKICSWCGGRR